MAAHIRWCRAAEPPVPLRLQPDRARDRNADVHVQAADIHDGPQDPSEHPELEPDIVQFDGEVRADDAIARIQSHDTVLLEA